MHSEKITNHHDPLKNVSGKFLTCPFCGREIVTDAYVTKSYFAIVCEKCKTVIETEQFVDEIDEGKEMRDER